MANIKKTQEMLMTAIFEVLEKMFFVFAEPLRGGGGNYQMKASVTFNGPVSGAMAISLSTGIAEAMVQNMLNLDPEEITEPIMADCVRESINMICGNFVRKLDQERVFDLSIPQFERISGNNERQQDMEDQALRLTFTADGGHIEVTLTAPDLLSQV